MLPQNSNAYDPTYPKSFRQLITHFIFSLTISLASFGTGFYLAPNNLRLSLTEIFHITPVGGSLIFLGAFTVSVVAVLGLYLLFLLLEALQYRVSRQ